MITPERISIWLQEPHQLQEITPNVLLQLTKEFPYFSVAQYLLYLSNNNPNTASLSILQQQYPVNNVLLQYLVAAKDNAPLNEDIGISLADVNIIQEKETELVIEPMGDYFSQQGIDVSNDLPEEETLVTRTANIVNENNEAEEDKSLMVVMGFAEWLLHISKKGAKEREEKEEQRALKSMWQQQKLAAMLDDEEDEIPEQVFEMAVKSITKDEDNVNETFANIYVKQGKIDKAIDIYKKLSLIYPEKSAYFAAKIESLQKEL